MMTEYEKALSMLRTPDLWLDGTAMAHAADAIEQAVAEDMTVEKSEDPTTRHRSAMTGRYVSEEYALKHPDVTYTSEED
jgi:hypothetical protein